jgi:DNA polymerase-1
MLPAFGQTTQERAEDTQSKVDYWKKRDFRVVQTLEALQELCAHLTEHKSFAVDTETTGLQALTVDLVGISFCAHEDVAYYVPCGHKTGEDQLASDTIIAALKPILENSAYKKYLHNAKYDQLVFFSHGIELAGIALDTLIGSNLIIKEWQSASLKNVSRYFFNEEMLTYDEVVKTAKLKDFSYVPLAMAAIYSCADSYQTLRLVAVIEKEFEKEKKLKKLYYDIEHPLTEILYTMEKEGIALNIPLLQELDQKVVVELATIEKQIADVMGTSEINLNSPRQIEELLFYKLQLPVQKKTSTGKYSTDQEVLIALAVIHPIPALIIKYRELTKLKSTYIDSLPTYVNRNTKRIHTTFSQTATATGRLASSNPNLQNIPADATGYGIEVRAAFQAQPGTVFVSADYSQIELRVLAYLSQDANLLQAFLQGNDIHRETAARIFAVSLDNLTHEQRQLGKRINFSILYGLTPYGLSKDLGISFKDARLYIERYFEQYPRVSIWMTTVIEATKKDGYVETLWGRRRYIPAIYERNRTLYEEACRIAINTVGQGTAAEIMKLGMINLNRQLAQQYPDARIVLQIHDELLISVAADQAVAVEQLVKKCLESVVDWNVPLTVETHFGTDWKQVTK